METLSLLAGGFAVALNPFTLMLAVAGCIIGTMVGALPGLGPSNGVAILIPLAFSFGLDATEALILMTSVYYGAMYGGRISSILLNIPGGPGGFPVRPCRVLCTISARLLDARGHRLKQPAQGRPCRMHRPGNRHDRARQFQWHAAFDGSFLAYMGEKSYVRDNSQFGKGDVRGVAAPEAGNNAAAGGALVPMLTLGVPGSGTTAVLLALLMTLNITPGPLLFTERPEVVWGLIAALLIANIVLLILNVPMVRFFVEVLSVPPGVLLPGVTMVSFVGIYSLSGSSFDLLLMIGFGILGYLLRKLDVPTVPIILGILLGNHMEDSLRRAMVLSGGEWEYLFSSRIAIGLWIAAIVGFIAPLFLKRFITKPTRADHEELTGD